MAETCLRACAAHRRIHTATALRSARVTSGSVSALARYPAAALAPQHSFEARRFSVQREPRTTRTTVESLPEMITFVTGNQNKLKEVTMLLDADLRSQKVDLLEIQGTYAEIIAHKVKSAAELVGGSVVVDDTGLEFEALGQELPGPYVKWFLDQLGPEGLARMLQGFENKGANAVCTVGYCEGPGKEPRVFQGKTHGQIVPPRGPQTFGWDCIFEPDGFGTTYAEMEKSEKNKISHRGRAFAALKGFLYSTSTL